MEANKEVFDNHEFDLPKMFQEVISMFSPTAASKSLELKCTVDPSIPQWFRGDSNRLRQVLTNLVGNAIKFTESGHVHVLVVPISDATASTLKIGVTVEDTGIGILRK